MKTCSKCGHEKESSKFSRDARAIDGLRSDCKDCCSTYFKVWRKENPVKAAQSAKRWRARNPDKAKDMTRNAMQRAYSADPGKHRERSRTWAASNKASRASKQSRRRAAGVCLWARKNLIDEVYDFAREFREAGFDVEVDHIEPLQGESVCGLHVESNLRVCLTVANRAKRNKQMEQFA